MEDTNKTVRGQILNIQHFCVDDGPGIRTTVFFKGCPLRCAWCHNPETYERGVEIMYRPDRCRGCLACVAVCPTGAHRAQDGVHTLDRTDCIRCGACATVCTPNALERAGNEMSAEEILRDVLSDRIFYETSNGGVTLSGGEPTAQPDLAVAILEGLRREGIHTAMETSGVCSPDVLDALIPLVDLFLLDWKHSDEEMHKKYTGVSNRRVRETLARLEACGASVHLRCPLIPGVNDTEAHIEGIASLANSHTCIQKIDLEPYHPLGVGKAEAIGKSLAYQSTEFMDNSRAEALRDALSARVHIPVHLSGK